MRCYYKREYKYLLIREKHRRLTDNIINKLPTNNLKDIIQNFSREDDSGLPTKKTDIIERAKFVIGRISYSIEKYLKAKGINKEEIANTNSYLTATKLTSEYHNKVT